MWLFTILVLADTALTLRLPVAAAETLRVTITGAGAPVVLVPGLSGSAFAWRKVSPLLVESGYRAIVIEPLGVGRSTRPQRADYSLTAQADRLAAVFDSLQIRGAIVVGHSLGGSMALRLAYRRTDLVAGLVLIDGGPAESPATPGVRQAARYAPWIKVLGVGAIRKKMRESLIKASGNASWVTDDVVEEYITGFSNDLDGTLRALLRMADAKEPELLQPHLAQIECPVRLLMGLAPHPEMMKRQEIDRLRSGLGTFAVDSVPGVGHYVHEERPEVVSESVLRASASLAQATLHSGRAQ